MKEAGGHHRPGGATRRLQASVCDAASSDRMSVRETQQACRNDGKCQIRTTHTVNTPITRALIYGHASSSPSLLDTSMRGLHHEPVLLAIVGHEDDIAVGGPDEAGQLQVVLGTWGCWLHWWNLVGLNAAELGGRVQHPDAAQQTGVHLRRTRIHQAPESICNMWPKRGEPQESEPPKTGSSEPKSAPAESSTLWVRVLQSCSLPDFKINNRWSVFTGQESRPKLYYIYSGFISADLWGNTTLTPDY